MMKYRLLLTDTYTGNESEIVVPANMILEDLSANIKAALNLPYYDDGWHCFKSHGYCYMQNDNSIADEEIRGECQLPSLNYRDSEKVRLKHLFTVIGSALQYEQDNNYIRCMLMERLK